MTFVNIRAFFLHLILTFPIVFLYLATHIPHHHYRETFLTDIESSYILYPLSNSSGSSLSGTIILLLYVSICIIVYLGSIELYITDCSIVVLMTTV